MKHKKKMKEKINLDMFNKVIKFPALKIPAKTCAEALNKFGKKDFEMSIKRVFDTDDKDKKLLLLHPKYFVDSKIVVPDYVKKFISAHKEEEIELAEKEVEVSYRETHIDDMLKQILPSEMHTQLPGAFESVGHIAHLNLSEMYLPYKQEIAEIILCKHKGIKTVVNKVGGIDNVYRTFEMELLAGEPNYIVRLYESRCWFEFDFRKVYWNSRLQMEHSRLIGMVEKDQVVCDMFAGVGPFAVPCARRKEAVVYANDLNPESYHYLEHNRKLNKIPPERLRTFNLDAREFIRKIVREERVSFDVAIMNLPKSALEFLDVFVGLFEGFAEDVKLPKIHCYCFSRAEDLQADVKKRASQNLGFDLSQEEGVQVYKVRDVAPKKYMMCISFLLPRKVAFGVEDLNKKKRKIDQK